MLDLGLKPDCIRKLWHRFSGVVYTRIGRLIAGEIGNKTYKTSQSSKVLLVQAHGNAATLHTRTNQTIESNRLLVFDFYAYFQQTLVLNRTPSMQSIQSLEQLRLGRHHSRYTIVCAHRLIWHTSPFMSL